MQFVFTGRHVQNYFLPTNCCFFTLVFVEIKKNERPCVNMWALEVLEGGFYHLWDISPFRPVSITRLQLTTNPQILLLHMSPLEHQRAPSRFETCSFLWTEKMEIRHLVSLALQPSTSVPPSIFQAFAHCHQNNHHGLHWWHISVTSLLGTHQDAYTTKGMWSNASQTTSAGGLNDRITVCLGDRFTTVHLWADHPRHILKPSVNRV